MLKSYYDRNTEAIKKLVYDRRSKIKEWYWSLKIGKKCKNCKIVCELKKVKKFHFHHKNPQTKLFNISDAVTKGYSIKTIKKELKKCTLLCDECHAR
jgi:hypothetical protein